MQLAVRGDDLARGESREASGRKEILGNRSPEPPVQVGNLVISVCLFNPQLRGSQGWVPISGISTCFLCS